LVVMLELSNHKNRPTHNIWYSLILGKIRDYLA